MGKHCNRLFGKTKTGACFYSGKDRLKQGKAKLLSRGFFFFFFFSNRFDDFFRGERGRAKQREGKELPESREAESNAIVAGRGSEWSLIVRDSFEKEDYDQ